MADSEVAICNQAIGWLGGTLITSLTEDLTEAKLCNANYAQLRDAVLGEREWTFAVERIEPVKLTTDPKYGFNNQFQIPPSVIRVLQVSRAGTDSGIVVLGAEKSPTGLGDYNELPWLREGSTIRCNADQIYARVIQRITDTTKFSSVFDQALAARIAMDLAIPLTNSRSLMETMAQLYGEKLRAAAAVDGMQGRSYKTRANALISVR